MNNTQKTIIDYLNLVKDTIDKLDRSEIEKTIEAFMRVYEAGKTIYIFGNGGSAASATHAAGDFVKGASFGLEKRFRVISLVDNLPALMAIANDVSYDDIFVEQLKNFIQPGDLVIGISGSGNSANVVKAMEFAKSKGVQTVAFCGFKGGKIKAIADISVHSVALDMEVAEDIHMMVFNVIKKEVMRRLHSDNTSMGSTYDARVK
ncbi:MAG TPA: SIS domain-containing protein [Cyclobacteriaceae bacterium]|nr:SIS domain-containing protein [Cyclobacteriaceae bacterium]HMV10777.1 SIS domain-containing protein [Cyclobacteriaceae bacterium]HMV88736.1 SIS domain-containing protein [Cyclobacteriaceae bacterium]HMX02370.1 SIS domain-containing protein [Cyclobacteriaceae bacterium]HMX51741.1 SIS domain-containing protein [Cyclobacteriaceae bacterium]